MANPLAVSWSRLRWFLRSWGDKLLMAVVFAAATFGLTRINVPAPSPGRALEAAGQSGSGVIVHPEVVQLWIPESSVDLARSRPGASVASTHQELRTFLERQGQQSLWYALLIRGHQVDGGFADITFIRRPYSDPDIFPEFLVVLATVAGNPPRETPLDFSTANVQLLPRELSEREPRAVVEELLRQPCPSPEHPK